jgi:primosomal protein N''
MDTNTKTEVLNMHAKMADLHQRLSHVHRTLSVCKPKTFASKVLSEQANAIYKHLTEVGQELNEVIKANEEQLEQKKKRKKEEDQSKQKINVKIF